MGGKQCVIVHSDKANNRDGVHEAQTGSWTREGG